MALCEAAVPLPETSSRPQGCLRGSPEPSEAVPSLRQSNGVPMPLGPGEVSGSHEDLLQPSLATGPPTPFASEAGLKILSTLICPSNITSAQATSQSHCHSAFSSRRRIHGRWVSAS